MITSLALTSLLMYSTMISGSEAYQGIDMSDEEFNNFVDVHYDMLDTVGSFIADNRANFETGVIGSISTLAVRSALYSAHPVTNLVIVGGINEVAKNVYKNAVYGKVAKEERIAELERQLAVIVKEVNQLKNSGDYGTYQYVSAGDFSSGYSYDPREGRHDERSSVYSIGGTSYTTDSREAGPHRSEYRVHRDSSTREIKDTIDRIYHDSMNPRKDYVTKSDNSDD